MILQGRARRWTPAVEATLVVAGFTALACAATYPLVRQLTTALPNDLGDPLLITWILAWDAGRMAHAFHGVWNPPVFFPYPRTLTYSEHFLGVALFTAPIQWVSRNPLLAFNVAFIGSFVLAGVATYLLARELTGRRDAALVAGLIFAFTPYRFTHIAHLQVLMCGWLPLSLWALHRYWSTGAWRYLLVSGLAYVLLSLSNMYFMYYGVVPLAIVGVAGLLRYRRPPALTLAHVTAVAALALLALAPVISVYYRVRQDAGFTPTHPEEILAFSAAVDDYARGHVNVWVWRHLGQATGEHELFLGLVALALAAFAIAMLWRKERDVRLYALIALVAFILSLGPAPVAWGHHLPFAGPYAWLIKFVPGFDGMRSVARMSTVVLLAVAVLAAFGAARLFDRFSRARQPLVTGAVAVLILAEGWAAPIRTAHFDPAGDPIDRSAYAYLAQAPPGAVLEMPIALRDPIPELIYQYMTLVHRHPTVNGSSRYETPLFHLLHGDESALSNPAQVGGAIDMIRGLGVRYLLIHPAACDAGGVCDRLIRALESDPRRVLAERRFDRVIVYSLAPPDAAPPEPPGLQQVPASAIRARASHSSDRVPLLFDGDLDSRWLTGVRQAGDEWIELEFDHPRDVRRIRLQMADRSVGDYPRELAIDVVEGGSARTVFQGSVLPQFVRSLVADGNYPFIDVALPPNHARVVRLRQLGTTHVLFWSIHELQLWDLAQ